MFPFLVIILYDNVSLKVVIKKRIKEQYKRMRIISFVVSTTGKVCKSVMRSV